MTDDGPDRDRDEGRNEDRDEHEGLPGLVRHIVDALADAEREGRSGFQGTGRTEGGRFSTEYGFSGRIGESRPDTGPRSSPGSDRNDGDDEESSLVDVRYGDSNDEIEIVADLPGVDIDDLSVGLTDDDKELVIVVEGRPLERVPLPWSVADVDSRFRNGVLELRITRGDDE